MALMGSSLLSIPFVRRAHADILTNAATQRIGNYNIYMKTVPPNPVAGQNTEILFEISTVNGEQMVDQPLQLIYLKTGLENRQHTQFLFHMVTISMSLFLKNLVYMLSILVYLMILTLAIT